MKRYAEIFRSACLTTIACAGAAVRLVGVGLAPVGIIPGLQRLNGRLIDAFSILRNRSQRVALRTSSALLLGMAWCLAPCAVVYNTLMTPPCSAAAGNRLSFHDELRLANGSSRGTDGLWIRPDRRNGI